jgi:tryptophan 7-halogenase
MLSDYEEIRDFIVLHYSATARDDSPFWQWCKNITLPDSLQQRIELFKGQGALREGVDELFRGSSWQSVFEGMGIRPSAYGRGVENLEYAEIAAALVTAKTAIAGMVAHLPTHEQFLRARVG